MILKQAGPEDAGLLVTFFPLMGLGLQAAYLLPRPLYYLWCIFPASLPASMMAAGQAKAGSVWKK